MDAKIIDRGRGPEIAGTRITVYDIWDYAREGDHHSYIAVMLGISSTQVQAALDYIEQHKEEVLAQYQRILDRAKEPYSPEVQAKVDEIRAKYNVLWAERRKNALENGDAAIMADNDIQGQMVAILMLLRSESWHEIWSSLNLSVRTFVDLSLSPDASDAIVWHACQAAEVILITGNRNEDGADSLQATIRAHVTPNSLPVFTISEPTRITRSGEYAHRVVETLVQYLLDIDKVRGAGRLWLP